MSYRINIVYKDVKNLKISLDKENIVTVTSPRNITKKEITKLVKSKKIG